jgi:SAM-dependent methyltransferase
MRNPEAVIAGVWRALRPGGRFVGEFGGHGCVAKIRKALVDALNRRGIDGAAAVPWYFPTVKEYSARLKKAGFSTHYIRLIPRPTPLPGDVTGWLETFGESFTACLPPSEQPAYIREVREALVPLLSDREGKWTADYVRLRFATRKQG